MGLLSVIVILLEPLLKRYFASKSIYFGYIILTLGYILTVPQIPSSHLIDVNLNSNISVEQTKIDYYTNTYNNSFLFTVEYPKVKNSCYYYDFFLVIWIVGGLIYLTYQIVKHIYCIKSIQRWFKPIHDKNIILKFNTIKNQLGIRSNVDIKYSAFVKSPLMIGYLNSTIVLPILDYSKFNIDMILKHELTHFKRKDLYIKLLLMIVSVIHWFNPMVHILINHTNELCEISCDDEVLKNKSFEYRKEYSKNILNMTKNSLNSVLSTNLNGGNNMKKRIFSIMDTKNKRKGIIVVCLALISTLYINNMISVKAETESNITNTNYPTNIAFNDHFEYKNGVAYSKDGVEQVIPNIKNGKYYLQGGNGYIEVTGGKYFKLVGLNDDLITWLETFYKNEAPVNIIYQNQLWAETKFTSKEKEEIYERCKNSNQIRKELIDNKAEFLINPIFNGELYGTDIELTYKLTDFEMWFPVYYFYKDNQYSIRFETWTFDYKYQEVVDDWVFVLE